MPDTLEKKLEMIVRQTSLIDYLRALQQINLPDAWLAGGAVRNTVWRYLHGQDCGLTIKDLDVVYFDPIEDQDKPTNYDSRLSEIYPKEQWECVNQAFIHTEVPQNDYWLPHAPYESAEASMRDWSFTTNAIGLRLSAYGKVEILVPFGLEDLFAGKLRLTPAAQTDPRPYLQEYTQRVLEACTQLEFIA